MRGGRCEAERALEVEMRWSARVPWSYATCCGPKCHPPPPTHGEGVVRVWRGVSRAVARDEAGTHRTDDAANCDAAGRRSTSALQPHFDQHVQRTETGILIHKRSDRRRAPPGTTGTDWLCLPRTSTRFDTHDCPPHSLSPAPIASHPLQSKDRPETRSTKCGRRCRSRGDGTGPSSNRCARLATDEYWVQAYLKAAETKTPIPFDWSWIASVCALTLKSARRTAGWSLSLLLTADY
ncbi:hypothetical protein V8E36_009788 [Tilletia maclaganii]